MLTSFKDAFFEGRTRSLTEVPSRPWKMQNKALFPRVDAMLERCFDLEYLLVAVQSLADLAVLEIGGIKVRASCV